jgi:hypothetical protein
MSKQASNRRSGILVSVFAVAVVVCAGVLLFNRSAERSIEEVAAAQMKGSVRLVASQIRRPLDEVAAGLRGVALRCGSSDSGTVTDCAADLERLRLKEPALFAATMILDRIGRVLATTPPRVWREDERVTLEEAQVRASRGGGESLGVSSNPIGAGKTVFVVVSVPGASTEFGAVGVASDLGRMGTALIDGLAADGQGVAFLAADDGRLLLASDWDC